MNSVNTPSPTPKQLAANQTIRVQLMLDRILHAVAKMGPTPEGVKRLTQMTIVVLDFTHIRRTITCWPHDDALVYMYAKLALTKFHDAYEYAQRKTDPARN